MRLHHLIRYLTTQAWAIEPGFLVAGKQLLREAVSGRSFSGADIHAALDVPMPDDGEREARSEKAGRAKIAVVPIFGVVESHTSSLGTSAREIDRQVTGAMMSKDIDAVLFDIESPGGVVTGVPELADKIASFRGTKPMLAFNGGMMASAAYWIGAAAGEVMTTPSGLTGSIGVFTWHEDWTEHLKNEGIKVTEVKAGEFKTEGAPWNPLTGEAREALQRVVDGAYQAFVKSVADSRKDTQTAVREGYGQARVLRADDAQKANLVDSVGTFDDAVARLAGRVKAAKPKGRRAASLERELALDVMRRVS